jgi:ABC-type multidrug transport system ATPase subunit
MQRRTTIIIAHRLSSVRMADRILVLDKGRIVEEGPHRELMSGDTLYGGCTSFNKRPLTGRLTAVRHPRAWSLLISETIRR